MTHDAPTPDSRARATGLSRGAAKTYSKVTPLPGCKYLIHRRIHANPIIQQMRDLFELYRERFAWKEKSHVSVNGPHPLASHVTPGRLDGPQTRRDLGAAGSCRRGRGFHPAGCLEAPWGWGLSAHASQKEGTETHLVPTKGPRVLTAKPGPSECILSRDRCHRIFHNA